MSIIWERYVPCVPLSKNSWFSILSCLRHFAHLGNALHGGCVRACGAHSTPACHLPCLRHFAHWGHTCTGVAFALLHGGCVRACGALSTPACHLPCLRHFALWVVPCTGVAFALLHGGCVRAPTRGLRSRRRRSLHPRLSPAVPSALHSAAPAALTSPPPVTCRPFGADFPRLSLAVPSALSFASIPQSIRSAWTSGSAISQDSRGRSHRGDWGPRRTGVWSFPSRKPSFSCP